MPMWLIEPVSFEIFLYNMGFLLNPTTGQTLDSGIVTVSVIRKTKPTGSLGGGFSYEM